VDAEANPSLPDGATWIDLEEPTRAEEKLVERWLGIEIPTQDDLTEIEPSSRLYEQHGGLYMTLSTLAGVEEGAPVSEPIGFVLAPKHLVTVRYFTPKPMRVFQQHVRRSPEIACDALSVLVRLLDAIVDRLADELEVAAKDINTISRRIFRRDITDEKRISSQRLEVLLLRIGQAQELLNRIRETAVSASRAISFLGGSTRLQDGSTNGAREHVKSLSVDVTSLADHATFLTDNLTFLLDASLGLISIEQNAAMKLFSWVAIVFLPPTLIAGIYGMNFHVFPELGWRYGYPLALVLMLVSAVAPWWYFHRRGWL
jgi:magnesium transporter